MYSPPDRGIDPPRIPQTSGKPIPASTREMMVAMIRLPPRYTPRPRLIMTQMLGVSPWFMKPTPKASHMLRPRTRPLAFRANAISPSPRITTPHGSGTPVSAARRAWFSPAGPQVTPSLPLPRLGPRETSRPNLSRRVGKSQCEPPSFPKRPDPHVCQARLPAAQWGRHGPVGTSTQTGCEAHGSHRNIARYVRRGHHPRDDSGRLRRRRPSVDRGRSALSALWAGTGRRRCGSKWSGGRRCSCVAEAGGELVGVVLGTHDGRKGWINRLAVAPAYQRRGHRRAGWCAR